MYPSRFNTLAISAFRREYGTSTSGLSALFALRIRVSMSPMESVTFIGLPTRLHHAGDFTLAGQFAEADAADLEPPNIRAPTAAVLAAVVLPRRELGWP